MSPVFGHGRLRLYLLKLLEESPRHGYEVIRTLQDRFLGVYSPSPGTIYPRLARLEEEGLVTHEVIDGKKVFTITDKGRAELIARMDELAQLEREITASVQDIAREVKEDVRQTVRSLREELTQMARDMGRAVRRTDRDRRRDHKEDRQAGREWRNHERRLAESERRRHELRRVWEEIWSAAAGGHPRGRAEAELWRLLAEFAVNVHRAARAGQVTEAALAECRAALDEATERIRTAFRS